MLLNGSEARRLHVVTPAAQPVIIPYRRHIRKSVLLAARSLGQRVAQRPQKYHQSLGIQVHVSFHTHGLHYISPVHNSSNTSQL